MKESICIKQNAKINLTLDILKKVDKKHLLDTVTAEIDIYDAVTVFPRFDSNINVMFSSTTCLINELDNINNTAYKMTELIMKKYDTPGADIYIKKNIPICSGLGGSSVDAVAVAKCLDKLYKLRLDEEEYNELFSAVGSDLNIIYRGGYNRAKNIGTSVQSIDSDIMLFLLIIMKNGVNTEKCFKKYDEIEKVNSFFNSEKMHKALIENDYDGLLSLASNDLLYPAVALEPTIGRAIHDLKTNNAQVAFLSGSGGACVGIFETKEDAEEARKKLNDFYPFCVVARTC